MPPRFNLLPHRQMRATEARRTLVRQVAVVVLLSFASALAGEAWLSGRIASVTAENQILDNAINALLPDYRLAGQLQARYAHLIQRQQLIETLDARRSTSVLLLADIADALPAQVYLTRLEENGTRVLIVGSAVDSTDIARFMERLATSRYLTDVALSEIRSPTPEAAAPFEFMIEAGVRLAMLQTLTSDLTPPETP